MAFVVVYDSCVLFSPALRDSLLRFAGAGLVRARWTHQILDEAFRAIRTNRPNLDPDALRRTRELMIAAVPDCIVTGHDGIIAGICLPDENDRHVVAAAIRCGAQAIVTQNLKDFPRSALSAYNIEALSPDEFILDLLDLAPLRVLEVLAAQAAALKNPPRTVRDLLVSLRRCGLPESVAKINEILERIEAVSRL